MEEERRDWIVTIAEPLSHKGKNLIILSILHIRYLDWGRVSNTDLLSEDKSSFTSSSFIGRDHWMLS